MRINGKTIGADEIAREAALHAGAADPASAARRCLAMRELLLQRAAVLGMLEDGVCRDAVTFASRADEDGLIAQVLEREVHTPKPTPEECRRFHAAHPERFSSGELVEARHILFAVTSGTPVMALRQHAQGVLAELRRAPEHFVGRARDLSNCPSAADGGSLGQFGRGTMVPEFDRAVFATSALGILPELVATRYGFHIVDVVRRIAGRTPPFEVVAERVGALLAAEVERSALRQYVQVLAGNAMLEGVDLEGAVSPLVQ